MVASSSDHSPIKLFTKMLMLRGRTYHSRFENSWFLEDGLSSVVMNSWSRGGNVLAKLFECGIAISK